MSDKEKRNEPGADTDSEPLEEQSQKEGVVDDPREGTVEDSEASEAGGDSVESSPDVGDGSQPPDIGDGSQPPDVGDGSQPPTMESETPVWEIDEELPPPTFDEEPTEPEEGESELAEGQLDEDPQEAPAESLEDSGPISREEKLKRLQRKNRKKNEDNVPRAVVDAVKKRVQELTESVAERDARLQEVAEQLEQGRAEIEAVTEERDEIQNRLLRTAADLENFRRRAEREKEELKRFGIDKVVLELIPAVDNLERALEHAQVKESEGSASFIDGVRMVYRQVLTALEKHGVKGFDSVGDRFDPERHEAIQQVEISEYETGVIVEEFQKGYFLHDRLLRPAMVSVAKQVESAQDEDSAPEDDESILSEESDAQAPEDESMEEASVEIDIDTDGLDESSGEDVGAVDDDEAMPES